MTAYWVDRATEYALRPLRERTESLPSMHLSEDEAVHARAMLTADPEPWFTEIVGRHKKETAE